jgi:hypothetical protein
MPWRGQHQKPGPAPVQVSSPSFFLLLFAHPMLSEIP